MTPAARVQAAIGILDQILTGQPAEQALTGWSRRSRFAGSKDRAAVRDHVFDALRCRRSFAALGGGETGRGLMLGAARAGSWDLEAMFDGSTYGPAPVQPDETGRKPRPGAEAGDIPDWLWPEFERSVPGEATAAAAYLKSRAPVFLRANLRKTDAAGLIQSLKNEGVDTVAHPLSPTALDVVEGARRLRATSAFQTGAFEFQDAASQAVVDALELQDNMRVLDYCAGGGGKTLAMGAKAALTLVAHDAHPRRMRDLPDRAKRAGLDVALSLDPTECDPFDLVFCDAPCSGSGSWRRAPDGKWILTADKLTEICAIQDDILHRASRLVRADGVLAYATCSVLRIENEDRVHRFLDTSPDWACSMMRRWPLSGGGDGFFLATFSRK